MSEKILYRLATTADSKGILDIYGPVVENSITSFEMEVPSGAVMENRIASTLVTYPWMVACLEEKVVGYAYAGLFRTRPAYAWSAETSVYIHHDHIKQGIGKALYDRLLALLEVQGFKNAFAGMSVPNPGSVRFHTQMGFREIGTYEKIGFKNGIWVDTYWTQKEIGEKSANDLPPVPLSEWLKDDQHISLLEKLLL